MLNITENIESITESSIDRHARNMKFMLDIMEQNKEMERYVNECLIKSSGNKRAIQEMYVVMEAAAGDKIKAFFQKIKDFFKKIFTKLGASLSAVFQEQKKYCEQYAYIITKCKWQAGDVNDIKAYFTGIPRIVDMVDNHLDQALFGQFVDKGWVDNAAGIKAGKTVTQEDLDKIPPKKDSNVVKGEIYNSFINVHYWQQQNLTTENDSNGAVDIDKTFRAYFDGAADTVAYSGDEIENNFQLIINNVYAGQAYLNKLEKIVLAVDKKMDAIQKASETELKQLETKLNEVANKAKEAPKQGEQPKQGEPQGGNNQQQNSNGKTFKQADINNLQMNNDGTYSYVASDGKTYTGKSEADVANQLIAAGFTKEAAIIFRNGSTYLNEFNLTNGASNDVDQKAATNNLTGTGVKNTTDAGKAGTAVANKQVAKTGDANVSGVTNAEAGKVKAFMDVVTHNTQAEINAMVQCTSAVTRAAFGSYKSANSDFFKIIQAHVQWYLSNPGSEKNNENQTTRGRNLDLNGGLSVEKKTQPKQQEGGTPPATT